MKKSWIFIMIILILSISLFFISCSKSSTNGTEPGGDNQQQADSLAMEAFEELNTAILVAEEPEDPQSGDDVFDEQVYNFIKSKFQNAINLDSDNALAHFGMSILEIASINYDNELWDIINDIRDGLGGKRILNNQFNFLIKTLELYPYYLSQAFHKNSLSFARIQNYIDDYVIPKLENALAHLAYAITLADTNPIMINTGEEFVELDCGEIYLFRATVYAICAGMKMFTLYDMDLFDEGETYDWTNNFWGMSPIVTDYWVEMDGDDKYLYLDWHDSDSLIYHIFIYNYNTRPGFLEYRDGNTPNSIKSDFENILLDMENSIEYINNETDDQQDDIIPIDYLTDLNEDIGDHSPDDPNFTQNWESINDVIDWIESLLDGQYVFNEDFDGDGIEEEFTIDLSRLFNPGLGDLKNYFPYHNWLPEDQWVQESSWQESKYGVDYGFDYYDEYVYIEDVDYIVHNEHPVKALEFLDGPDGNVIDPYSEFPYFPDYTLNGVFPGMDRDAWFNLFGNGS